MFSLISLLSYKQYISEVFPESCAMARWEWSDQRIVFGEHVLYAVCAIANIQYVSVQMQALAVISSTVISIFI